MPTTYRSTQGDSATLPPDGTAAGIELPDLVAQADLVELPDLVARAVAPLGATAGGPASGPASIVVSAVDDVGGYTVHDGNGNTIDSLDGLAVALGKKPQWRRPTIGTAPVPERESIVARRVADGWTTSDIADELGVSDRTVTTLRRRVREIIAADTTGAGSAGVSVIGASGLTRDVVHAVVQRNHGDVNDVGATHLDDRVRVLVTPTGRDFALAGAVRLLVVGAIPDGFPVVRAVAHGMLAQVSVRVTADALLGALDAVSAGTAALSDSMVQDLVDELQTDHRQPSELSDRDRDIVGAIRVGESVKQTARRLGVSPKTIENGRHRLYLRFGVKSAPELDRVVGLL